MHCNLIPDSLLKRLGDKISLRLSKKVRASRNRIRRFFRLFNKENTLTNFPEEKRLTYDCKNSTDLPGTLAATTETNQYTDEEVKDAHVGSDYVYEFLKEKFNLNSIDGNGLALICSVKYGKDYNNAFWNGEQFTTGSGDGKLFKPFAKDLTVIGHEIVHGLVQYTAGLVYYFQAGMANESFADIFGIAIKHWAYGYHDPKIAPWLIGDQIVGPDFPGLALRSFKDEKAYKGDPQPKHMNDFVWTLSDNGGVHIGSGILNHAFYLMCLNLNAASYEQPIQIMYRALLKLGKFSGFKKVAESAVAAAEELYGKDSWEVSCVLKAYKEVGIL